MANTVFMLQTNHSEKQFHALIMKTFYVYKHIQSFANMFFTISL